jgi:hypothetical protein
MARPETDAARILECADGVAGALVSAASLATLMDLRLRQVKRRVYGDRRAMDVLLPAIEQLRELAAEIHIARSLAREQLEVLRLSRRQEKPGGYDEGSCR